MFLPAPLWNERNQNFPFLGGDGDGTLLPVPKVSGSILGMLDGAEGVLVSCSSWPEEEVAHRSVQEGLVTASPFRTKNLLFSCLVS